VGTPVTAALIAVLALLTWAAAPAWADPATAHPAAGPLNTGQIAALAAVAAVLVGLVVLLSRRAARRRGRAAAPPGGPGTGELEDRTARALVETDDAIRTSDQELGFAVARFGESAAAPFSAALKSARAELGEAFKLRQQLDDETPEPEPRKRKVLTEISRRCAEANRLLDEQASAFDRLQDLEARAPEILAEVDHHVTQQAARLSTSERILAKLADKYTPDAVAIVATSPGQAGERLELARTALTDVRQALESEQADPVAVFLRAAESAADQAESLLDGIEHMEAELTQAASALPAALREIDVEITEATAPPAGRPDDRAAVVSRAHAAASAARDQMQSGAPFDALAALREVEEADAALDRSLASARTERDRQDRAGAVLDQVMLVARSAITAAGDFITTRRGGVGATARTRLAEAYRHFQQAIAFAPDNPEAAVTEAQRADALARQARAQAEQDVAQFSEVVRAEAGGFGGMATRGRHGIGGTVPDRAAAHRQGDSCHSRASSAGLRSWRGPASTPWPTPPKIRRRSWTSSRPRPRSKAGRGRLRPAGRVFEWLPQPSARRRRLAVVRRAEAQFTHGMPFCAPTAPP
jgi:tetratricopeptide (TPR) repeat protein